MGNVPNDLLRQQKWNARVINGPRVASHFCSCLTIRGPGVFSGVADGFLPLPFKVSALSDAFLLSTVVKSGYWSRRSFPVSLLHTTCLCFFATITLGFFFFYSAGFKSFKVINDVCD